MISRPLSEKDAELYARCVAFVSEQGKATPALLQRRFGLGYGKAMLLLDRMETEGILEPNEGAGKPRKVLEKKVDETGLPENFIV